MTITYISKYLQKLKGEVVKKRYCPLKAIKNKGKQEGDGETDALDFQ